MNCWRTLSVALGSVVVLIGAAASATTMRALDVGELSHQAEVVVVADVVSVGEVVVAAEGRLAPRTVTRVRVVETWAGSTPEEFSVVEPEGRLGHLVVHREGLASMRRGQRVLLFLHRRGGTYRPVGHSQGAWVLRQDRPSGETRVVRAGDPGLLIGSAKAFGVDLDDRPSLHSVRSAVAQVRGAP